MKNKIQKLKIAIIVLFLFFVFYLLDSNLAEAKNLYVNNSGSPACSDATAYVNNTTLSPWCTLGRALWGNANKSTPNSSEAAAAGDTVLVAAGTYSYAGSGTRFEPAFNPVNSGSSGHPITIRAVGTVTLTLSSSFGPVFGANAKHYITWDGFRSDENDHTVYGGEPFLGTGWDSNYLVFQNCVFIGKYLGEDERNHSAIRFEGATNARVYNNSFSGFTGSGENHADVYLYNSDDILVEHNNHSDGNAAIWVKGNNNERTIFRYNLVSNMAGNAVRFGPSSINGRIYQNIIKNSQNGLQIDNWLGALGSGNIIANNTVYGSTWLGIRLHGNDNPATFYNNIVVNSNDGAAGSTSQSGPTTYVFEHNLYYNFGSCMWYDQGTPGCQSWSYWQATFAKDTVSPAGLNANPLFVNAAVGDFHLQGGSPARTLGVDILDLDGDGSTTDTVPAGAYITGNEIIGLLTGSVPPPDTTPPSVPTGVVVN